MIEFFACGTHDQERRPSAFAVWAVGSEHQVIQAQVAFGMTYLPAFSKRKHYAVKEVVLSEGDDALQKLWDLMRPFESSGVTLQWLNDIMPGSPYPGSTNTFATQDEALRHCLERTAP